MAAFVNAMPELRRGIAAAAINQPFRSAVIVSQLIASGEAWEAKIEVLDAEEGNVTIYLARLGETTRQMLEVNLIASVKRIDTNALSLAINGDASFVIYTDAKEIKSALKTFGFQMFEVGPAIGIDTWPAALNRWHTKGSWVSRSMSPKPCPSC
jgi:hypothetical protein